MTAHERNEPRWLNPDVAAAYVGVRVERLRPLVKAGKLPAPSYHLGPNQPRFDRLALDRIFGGEPVDDKAQHTHAAFQRLADEIAQGSVRKTRQLHENVRPQGRKRSGAALSEER